MFLWLTNKNLDKIMSVIKDYATVVQGAFTAINADLVEGNKRAGDIVKGIQALNDTIAKLQGTAGAISAEDQALLDSTQKQVTDLKTQADALVEALPDPVVPPSIPATPFGVEQPTS